MKTAKTIKQVIADFINSKDIVEGSKKHFQRD